MATTRMKEQLSDWGRAEVAAKLSAHAYKSEKAAVAACNGCENLRLRAK